MKRLLLCALLAGLSGSACARSSIIFAEDAHSYVGQNVTVRGTVERVHHAGATTLVYLDGHNARHAFIAVIDPVAALDFPDVDTYGGKSIDVIGVVRLERGTPEIVVKELRQVYVK